MGEQSLIERLKAATGGSRELDTLIARVGGWHRVEPRFTRNRRGGWIAPEDFIGVDSAGAPILDSLHGTTIYAAPPRFTTSLDAIVGLIERNGWRLNSVDASVRLRTSVGLKSVEERHVDIPDENRSAWMYDYAGGAAKTLPLALCIALLSALQQGGAERG